MITLALIVPFMVISIVGCSSKKPTDSNPSLRQSQMTVHVEPNPEMYSDIWIEGVQWRLLTVGIEDGQLRVTGGIKFDVVSDFSRRGDGVTFDFTVCGTNAENYRDQQGFPNPTSYGSIKFNDDSGFQLYGVLIAIPKMDHNGSVTRISFNQQFSFQINTLKDIDRIAHAVLDITPCIGFDD